MVLKQIVKPFDPFENYRNKHLNMRERYIRMAINALKSSVFQSLSKLAEGVAQIVTQFEFKDAGVIEKTDKVRGCDASTLLSSKSKYRHLLVAEWAMRQGLQDDSREAISGMDALKMRCANLAHQNDLLITRLGQIGGTILPVEADAQLAIKAKDISMLIDIINGMFAEVSDLFATVMEGEEDNDHPVAGLYGPNGYIIGIEELRRFKEIQNEQKA